MNPPKTRHCPTCGGLEVRCEVCWTWFATGRSDAQTCSPRCRQILKRAGGDVRKARRAHKETEQGPSGPEPATAALPAVSVG